MQTSSGMFLNMLAQRGILSPNDIEILHQQVNAADPPIHPVVVARRLVEAGYLNAYHAKTLLAELAEAVAATRQQAAGDGATEEATQEADEENLLDPLGVGLLDQDELMGGTDVQVNRLATAQQGWLASWSGRRKPLRLERPTYERFLVPACLVLAACVVLLLILMITRAI
jgi:hypothetical protein